LKSLREKGSSELLGRGHGIFFSTMWFEEDELMMLVADAEYVAVMISV
jgi:hypothetical protein